MTDRKQTRKVRRGALRPLLTVVLAAAPTASGAVPADDLFVDAAASSGVDFVYFNGMSGELYFAEMMGGGAALLDYDSDGDLDLYLAQGEMLGDKELDEATFPPSAAGPLSDRLFRNDLWLDETGQVRIMFVDVTESAGIPPGGYGMGAASGDIDNDGWPDLYVTNFGSNRLLHNRGDGTFEDITSASSTDDRRWSVAASWFDYDADGLLDLYVGNYVDYRLATHRPCYSDTGVLDYCGPGGFSGESDRLFRNQGGGVFEDVSKRSHIAAAAGAGMGSVVGDFDGDGRPDIYVANDGHHNRMWLNQGDGTFSDAALLSGTAVNLEGVAEASMGIAMGDLDGDGLSDLVVSHLNAETNTYYRNEGSGFFSDLSNVSGLGLPSWPFTGFGVSLIDYDNDTDLDLFVANGAVKLIEEQRVAAAAFPLHQTNQLFRNEGGGQFVEVTDTAGSGLLSSEVSRGVATGDLDNDGDTDLVVVNNAGPARLLLNQLGSGRSWLGLVTRTAGGRDALGAHAWVELGNGRRLPRRVATDGSYASSGDPRVHWGLDLEGRVPVLGLRWPDGSTTHFFGVSAGAYLVVDRGGVRPREGPKP